MGADPRRRRQPLVVQQIAAAHDATPRQVALAWLIARSPGVLPIPGTGSVDHLDANLDTAGLDLSPAEVAAITEQAG